MDTVIGDAANSVTRPDRPIRVLHVICPSGLYGAEKWILAHAANNDRSAVELHLAVTAENRITPAIANCFTELGLPCHVMNLTHRFDLRAISQLVRLIRVLSIDIVHTHGYKSDIIGFLATRHTRTAIICTPHGFEPSPSLKLRCYIALGCRTLKHFDGVVPLSEDLLETLKQLDIPESRLHLIENGVDLSNLPLRRTPNTMRGTVEDDAAAELPAGMSAGAGGPIVGFIGQLHEGKNVRAILDAFNQLYRRHANAQLHLLGDGPEAAELKAHALTLPSRDNIVFHGYVDNPLDYLASFDLFVMTSKREGTPRCLMEAMGMGVPIAAFDIPGVRVLVTDELTGLLSPFGDTRHLCAQMERLICDAALSAQISQTAKAFVNARFSGRRMALDYETLYRRLLSSASSAEETASRTSVSAN